MENKIKKIALFGGSFDPVTNAHVDVVSKLSEKFDKVVVMPTFVSPFKQSGSAAEPKHRVEMLKKAMKAFENAEVSQYEIKKGGVSYTADTIENILQSDPLSEVFTVIGSEELRTLEKWNDLERLKKLTSFYVVERPRFSIDLARLDGLVEKGFKIIVAPFVGADVSSSEVRLSVGFGAKLPVPKTVSNYIVKNSLYNEYNSIIGRFGEFNLSPKRIEHTFGVAKAAIFLAKKNDLSVNKAIVAALLHDIAKCITVEALAQKGLDIPEEIKSLPEKIMHAPLGALVAEKLFGIADNEILDAIRFHTTLRVKASALDEVVFLADAIEEGRDNEASVKTRIIAYTDVKAAAEFYLKSTVDYLKKEGKEVFETTLKALNYYKRINKKSAAEDQTQENGQVRSLKQEDKVNQTEKNQNESGITNDPELKKSHDTAYTIGEFLCEKKAADVTLINISARTVIADYFVIASATSTTQVRALADYVDEKMSKNYGVEPLHRDIDAKWYVLDYGTVIVHIFYEELRKFFQLERLWADGTNTETVQDNH